MSNYNKLVRDNIIEIIHQTGKNCEYKVLDSNEFKIELLKKLEEEVEEYHKDNNVEELADIIEVVYSLARLHKCSPQQLEKIRAKKAATHGSFNKKIFLLEVKDK